MARFAALGGLFFVLALSAFAEGKKEVSKELEPFQGTWKVIDAARNGKTAPMYLQPDLTFIFDGEKVSVKEGKRDPDLATFSIDAKQDPRTIELVTAKGKKVLGIYKFDKDGKLTIAFNRSEMPMHPKTFDEKETDTLVMEKVMVQMKKDEK